ncbi:MAG: 6-phosphogluconolactonase [Pyrinomonadaceae bacterium]
MSPAGSPPDLHVLDTPEQVAHAGATRFVNLAREAIEAKGNFSVALAGGNTPKRVYELLASEEFEGAVAWPHVHLFFGDERCVPHDDPASNYRMANEALLSHVAVPAANVHRIEGRGDAKANASLYEDALRGYFGDTEWPRFDLILLGMGDDGHTASLFPNSDALDEQSKWVAANRVAKLDAWRITLTAPVINHAAHILFIVTGESKSVSLKGVLRDPHDPARLPAQLIRPFAGLVEWFVDRAAASRL